METVKRLFGILQTQPSARPRSEFADFDDLLEKNNQSTPGFETFSAVNGFEIKQRERKGGDDYWETTWKYDIVGDRRQSLMLALKETQPFNCFASYDFVVSAYTDLYSEPVFICSVNTQDPNQCCKITTANPKTLIGYITSSKAGKISLRNDLEGVNFSVSSAIEESCRACYDIWHDGKFVGSLTMEQGHAGIVTEESLSPASKVLLFALAFYLNA